MIWERVRTGLARPSTSASGSGEGLRPEGCRAALPSKDRFRKPLNGQCEQPNHPDYEDCECYGIIVEPMLPLCVHDLKPSHERVPDSRPNAAKAVTWVTGKWPNLRRDIPRQSAATRRSGPNLPAARGSPRCCSRRFERPADRCASLVYCCTSVMAASDAAAGVALGILPCTRVEEIAPSEGSQQLRRASSFSPFNARPGERDRRGGHSSCALCLRAIVRAG